MRSYSVNFVKGLLIAFNVAFIINAFVLNFIGTFIYANLSNCTIFYEKGLVNSSVLVFCSGLAVFVISILGCCGATKKNIILLNAFTTFLACILIMEILAGSMAAYYNQNFRAKFKEILKKSIKNPTPAEFTCWRRMQNHFECCGVDSIEDWGDKVPYSCYGNVTGTNEKILHKYGCYHQLEEFLGNQATNIIGITFGLILIKVLGIFLSRCLVVGMKKNKFLNILITEE
ncbi:unnamed protein product [Brassicogethes aeneus]|uniref:Tetraspanin n=1 Tax=Brassicogethes aeneus TaxID=1431903 RepID=A0A9P0B5M4_BRAAE|nr:unnamed protein product [Brassicogethes aeneus]